MGGFPYRIWGGPTYKLGSPYDMGGSIMGFGVPIGFWEVPYRFGVPKGYVGGSLIGFGVPIWFWGSQMGFGVPIGLRGVPYGIRGPHRLGVSP